MSLLHKSKLEVRNGLSPACGKCVSLYYLQPLCRGHASFCLFVFPSRFLVIMQRTAAKSVDGVNMKNTTCSHTVVLMWETWDCVACAYGNEAGGGGVLLQTTSTG